MHEDDVIGGINALFQQAVIRFQQRRLEEAETYARRVLNIDPDYPDANFLLGKIAIQRGHFDLAGKLIARAIKSNPREAKYYLSHGNSLRMAGRSEEALVAFKQAIEIDQSLVMAHHGLGGIFCEQGELEQALECYRNAIALKPDFAIAHHIIGGILQRQNKLERALACYHKAISLKPDFAEAYCSLGVLLAIQGKDDDALDCYRKAVSLKPDYAEAYGNIGNRLRSQFNYDEALAVYRKAVSLNPDLVTERWAIAMLQIPPHFENADSQVASRSGFSRELARLDKWFDENNDEKAYRVIGVHQPYFLAYQDDNNRDLLHQYGKLCVRLMGDWMSRQAFGSPPKKSLDAGNEIVKVGIVSSHFYFNSVWLAIIKGLIKHLDPTRFELCLFHVGAMQDEETDWARARASAFVQGKESLYQWVESILGFQPDVLIYPEIGMKSISLQLASLRLSPVQAVTWGHPETTGLPTMDYYLSAEDFEPLDAQDNYTEQLVSLPHLGCCYHPLPVVASEPDFTGLNIDPESRILICPGSPFKYAPQHDWMFAEIARRVERCKFVFFIHGAGELSEKLRKRLGRCFEQAGIDFGDYVIFIPWQEISVFYGLMNKADVFLDTIGFSGFNTAIQAVECGLPIVSREGRFMRGRFANGFLQRMGLSELIAGSDEEYIELAVRLIKDAEYRQYIHQRIEATRHVLFDDHETVRALEDFIVSKVKN